MTLLDGDDVRDGVEVPPEEEFVGDSDVDVLFDLVGSFDALFVNDAACDSDNDPSIDGVLELEFVMELDPLLNDSEFESLEVGVPFDELFVMEADGE